MSARGFRLQETEYPAVRRVMGPGRERIDDAALENVLAELFPGAEAMDVEDFMSSLQSFGRQAAPIAQRALPGIIQGAQQGAVLGPWGALAGAVAGGAGSLLSGGGGPAPGPAPGPPPPAAAPPVAAPFVPPAAPPTGSPFGAVGMPSPFPIATPQPPAAAAPAAAPTAQLMALLSRPETMQALLALLMGGAGRTTVPLAGRDVPAAAFANAIAETAARVAEVAGHPFEQSMSEYLFDSLGQPRGDLVNPSERAALLLSDLAAVAAQEALADQEQEQQEAENEAWTDTAEGFEQDAVSPLEAYENALMGYEGQ